MCTINIKMCDIIDIGCGKYDFQRTKKDYR